MGCPKLTYQEENGEIFFQGLWKKSASDFFRVDYYPFGLQTATSWTRENTTGNNFLANGATELNTTTSNYDLFYRNYDPALGRMNQVDPLASKYAGITPYNYAFNSPTVYSDPMGDDPYYIPTWLYNLGMAMLSSGPGRIQDSGNAGGPAGGFSGGGGSFGGGGGSGDGYGYGGAFDRGNFFSPGWYPGRGSLSSGAFARQDAAIAAGMDRAAVEKAFGNQNVSANGNGTYTAYVYSGQTEYSNYGNYSGTVSVNPIQISLGSSVSTTGAQTDFIYRNNNVIGLGIGILEPGFGAAIDAVRGGAFTRGATIFARGGGGVLVGINIAVTYHTISTEIDNGKFNTHSIVNGIVTGIGVGLTVTGLVITAPVWGTALAVSGAVVGVGYAIAQASGIDEWIDSKWGFK